MATGAKARKFDDLRARGETDGLRDPAQALGRGFGGHFADRAATIADEENGGLMGPMAVIAGHEGVAGGEAVDQPLLDQKIQRPVDRDRRRTLARPGRKTVDHLIGAQRTASRAQLIEHPPTGGRQIDPMAMGAGRIMRAMRMIPVASALRRGGRGRAKRLHGTTISRICAGIDSGFEAPAPRDKGGASS